MTLNQIAQTYVKLVLAIGNHHEHYIDAYYGPKEWKSDKKEPLESLLEQVQALILDIQEYKTTQDEQTRKDFLLIHAKSAKTFIDQLRGVVLSFDDESLALYDAKSPTLDEKVLDSYLNDLDKIIPGKGELNVRMNEFSKKFIIPTDKLDAVFEAAITESRRRTKKYIDLDKDENFTIEYVKDKVWSGYNWYKGKNYSVIQLNTDFPMQIDRAIDLASHEGYPGHHVFNSLMEKHLVDEKGWIEYSVYTLYSPLSLLAEGSANYGIELTFNKTNRMKFEKEVLFPLAGLDSNNAQLYYDVQDLLKKLSYAGNMVAQQYLDGHINKDKAIGLLMKYSLTNKEKSTQRVAFIEANRSYVINYNLGEDIVKEYVLKNARQDNEDSKWEVFYELLKNPKTASMMQ